MGIEKYNAECRAIVMRYSSEWRRTVERLGRWIDFDNDYKTLNTPFMESVWWVFGQLWKKDLVYRGLKVMPYTTGCTTPLSNFEAGQAYKDVQDPAGGLSSSALHNCLSDPFPEQSPLPSPSSPTLPSPFSPGPPLPGPFPPTSPSAYTPISLTSRFTTSNAMPNSFCATNSYRRSTRTRRRLRRTRTIPCWRPTRGARWLDGSTSRYSLTSRSRCDDSRA